jgi:hypothetical protein
MRLVTCMDYDYPTLSLSVLISNARKASETTTSSQSDRILGTVGSSFIFSSRMLTHSAD